MFFIGAAWRGESALSAVPLAQFDPDKVADAREINPTTGQSNPPPSVSNRTNQSDTLPQSTGRRDGAQTSPPPARTITTLPANDSVAWSNVTGTISGAGLIASYCCSGAFSTVTANKAVSSGRYYWELTLSVRAGEQHPDTWTDAGVTSDIDSTISTKRPLHVMPSHGNPNPFSVSAIGKAPRHTYRNGDVFMFALDAELGIVFHGLNGEWLNGRPGTSGGENIAKPGATFIPYVNLSASSSKATPEGDRWIANFGGSPFRYPLPSGFAPYTSSTGANPATTTIPAVSATQQEPGVTPQESQSPVNRRFENEITIGGQKIPLPEGRWVGLAFFRGAQNSTSGDAAILGKIEQDHVAGIVAINAYTHKGQQNGFPEFSPCNRTNYIHVNRVSNEAFGQQRCWWINHATQPWDLPIFQAAKAVIEQRKAAVPAVLVNVAFRRASKSGFASAFYYFNPEDAGIVSRQMDWKDSEWRRDRIGMDSSRVKYVQELRSWGESWAPVFYAMNDH